MPELPDLLYIQARLKEALVGRRVVAERLREPIVMRFAVRGNLSLLLGRRLDDVIRHAHFLVFRFEDLDLAVNPMLAGRFRLTAPDEKEERDLVFALTFEVPKGATTETAPMARTDLRYRDEKNMGKAYLLAKGDWKAAAGMDQAGGVDVLSPEFTRERLVSLLKKRRDQVRVLLLDKRALDSIGNAYADEILFEARLHPKTFCRSLSHDDAVRLHDAIVTVMREAVDEVARRGEPIDVKVRDFLKVRLRDVCPRCGAKVRKAGVRGMDAYFCPHCQPATRSGLVDWTKTGK
ncbi:MAG TPA: DNA-formamidopyrimidine glycosylase family protein [Vicinamibacteria bacterium]|jgi:formamidopyrimidine-DNA glycosylase